MPTRLEKIKEEITEAAQEGTPAIHWLYGREGAVQHSSHKGFGMYLPERQVAYDLSPLQAQKLANMLVASNTKKHHLAVTTDEQRISRTNVYGFYHNHWWVPTTIEGVCLHWAEYGESMGGSSACFVTIVLPPGEYEDAGTALMALMVKVGECRVDLPDLHGRTAERINIDPVDYGAGLINSAYRILERCKDLNEHQRHNSGCDYSGALDEQQDVLERLEYEFLVHHGLANYVEQNRFWQIPHAVNRTIELAREQKRNLKPVQPVIGKAVEIVVARLEEAARSQGLRKGQREHFQQQAWDARQAVTAADCGEPLLVRITAAEKTLRRRCLLLPLSIPVQAFSWLRDVASILLGR